MEENLKVKMKTKAGNVMTKRECRRRAQNRIRKRTRREKQEKKIKQRQDLSRGLACYGLPW